MFYTILLSLLIGQTDRNQFNMVCGADAPPTPISFRMCSINSEIENRFDIIPGLRDELKGSANALAERFKENQNDVRRKMVTNKLVDIEYGLKSIKRPFNKQERDTIDGEVEEACKKYDEASPRKENTKNFPDPVDLPVKYRYDNVYVVDPQGRGWRVSLYGFLDSNNQIQYNINEQNPQVINILSGKIPMMTTYYGRNFFYNASSCPNGQCGR